MTFFVSQWLTWQMLPCAVTDVNVFDGCCHVQLVNGIFTLVTHWLNSKDPSKPKMNFSFSNTKTKLHNHMLSFLMSSFFLCNLKKTYSRERGVTNYCPLCAMKYSFPFGLREGRTDGQGGNWSSNSRMLLA